MSKNYLLIRITIVFFPIMHVKTTSFFRQPIIYIYTYINISTPAAIKLRTPLLHGIKISLNINMYNETLCMT